MRELIALELIDANPWQPRTSDDPEHISNLAVSIAKDGLLQPPAARKAPSTEDGSGQRYQLAFGHSRHKAYQYLCLMIETDPNWLTDHGVEATLEQFAVMPLEIVTLDDEAMYRHAISENVQRKDLNPIEEAAAMKRAMDDFGYDSEKVGALFGKAGGTVRGMVRLLELPIKAQDMLSKGELSQNTARALLSMKRVASEDAIDNTLNTIRASGGQIVPEQQVTSDIERLRNTVSMWHDRREGKPRAGNSDGWLLDMKNFPNHLLKKLDAIEIASLLKISATDDRLAILIARHAHDPLLLVEILRTSDIETDRPLGEALDQLVNPPTCTACPFYTKINGTHFCGGRTCYDRKTDAWQLDKIQSASRQLGIAIYSEADGPFLVLESYNQNEEHHKLFDARHPDLRLISKDEATNKSRYSYFSQERYYKGTKDDSFLACITGKKLNELKLARKQARALEKAGVKTAKNSMELLWEKQHELEWEASAYFAEMLAGMNFSMLNALCRASYNLGRPSGAAPKPHEDAPEIEREAWLRRVIALDIVEEFTHSAGTVSVRLAQLMDAAEKCGVELPASLADMAAEADREIAERFPPRGTVAVTPASDDEDDDFDPDAEIFAELDAEEKLA